MSALRRSPWPLQVAGLDALLEVLDGIEGQRGAADDHLQAVVVRRVVAAGDRDAGVAAQFVGSEISQRGRHAADIDGVDAGGADAVHQGAGQFRAGQAAIAADGDGRLALFDGQRGRAWPTWRTTSAVSDLLTMPRMS